LRCLAGIYGFRLVPKSATADYVEPNVWEITEIAVPLVSGQEEIDGVSGEYRRHQVYAKLIKMFPDEELYDIAYALERAVRKFKGVL